MRNIVIRLFLLSSILTSSVKAEEQLTATIIGSGSPIYNKNRASASVLVSAGNTHILVDMGNGAQANLDKLDMEVRDLSGLFFTHHHLDHKADNNQSSTVLNSTLSYPIVDTGQKKFYSNDGVISLPTEGEDFFGQDGNYIINEPSYTNNHDGTITDNVTGLMWQEELGDKLSYDEALSKIQGFKLAGYADWRIATLKELYSLIQFTGTVKGEKAIPALLQHLVRLLLILLSKRLTL